MTPALLEYAKRQVAEGLPLTATALQKALKIGYVEASALVEPIQKGE